MENPSDSCSGPNATDGAFADPGISSPGGADRLIACLIDYNLASVCAITGTITSRPAASQHYGSTHRTTPQNPLHFQMRMIIIYISGFGQADARATRDFDRGHHANEAGHLAGLGDGDSGRTGYCGDRGRQCAHRVDEPESALKGSILFN